MPCMDKALGLIPSTIGYLHCTTRDDINDPTQTPENYLFFFFELSFMEYALQASELLGLP